MRKSLKKWVKTNVDEAIRLADGGKDVTEYHIVFDLPDCDCPRIFCPPIEGCAPCPKANCPPCRQCVSRNKCEPCEEDKAIRQAVSHFMAGHKMEVCPPEEDYCGFEDLWPVDLCGTPENQTCTED